MKNYFIYLPAHPNEAVWGNSVTALGFTRVPPHAAYPLSAHPSGHNLCLNRGRVLESFQIVLLTEGSGWLECGEPGRRLPVEAGQAFLLFPGVWHRYAPVPETGWVEHWMECRGPAYTAAWQQGLIDPERPVVDLGGQPGVHALFVGAHDRMSVEALEGRHELAVLGVTLLAQIVSAGHLGTAAERELRRVVQRVERLLLDRCDRPLDVPELAREIGWSEVRLRRAFQHVHGTSLRAFHRQVRMRRAGELLAHTALTVKEVAEQLGFSSAFHFSEAFKDSCGLSPAHWRRSGVRPAAS